MQEESLNTIIERVNELIINSPPVQAKEKVKTFYAPTAAMPNEICRVSPFFPLKRQDPRKREYLRNEVITDNAWGKLLFTGPRLTTYEEDILLAILSILDDPSKRTTGKFGELDSYAYSGSLLPILKLAGLKSCGKNYKRVKTACGLLMSSFLELQSYSYVEGVRKVKSTILTNMIMFYGEEEDKHTIVVNPFFYRLYKRGNYSLLDIEKRLKIKSNIGKCLYRFVVSQDSWKGHYLTLADAINLNKNIENKIKKNQLVRAIKELIQYKILDEKSKIVKDMVILKKHPLLNSQKRNRVSPHGV